MLCNCFSKKSLPFKQIREERSRFGKLVNQILISLSKKAGFLFRETAAEIIKDESSSATIQKLEVINSTCFS